MIGNLGQINLSFLQGWAFKQNSSVSSSINILLDNTLLGTTRADIPRKDIVKAGIHEYENCGFKYYFNENIDIEKYKILRVVFTETGKDLRGSPVLISNIIDTKSKKKQNIKSFFLHIPKTAGTSFRLELINYLGEDKLYPNLKDLKENNEQYPTEKQLPTLFPYDRKSIEVISGHYGYNIKQELFPDSITMAFFREPIARAISNLKHLQRHSNNFKDKTLLEIAKQGNNCNSQVNNRQTFMLWDGNNINEKFNIEKAKQTLQNIEFIGITEYYKESINLCNKTFNWQLSGNLFTNKGGESQDTQIEQELLDYLNEHNKLDIQLYKLAVSIFKSRCVKNNILLL